MKLAPLLLIMAMIPNCRCTDGSTEPVPLPAASPRWKPTRVEESMKSYVAEYASAARNSRVGVPFRPLAAMGRVTRLDAPALSVVVDPAVEHVGVVHHFSYGVFTAGGGGIKSGESTLTKLQLLQSGYLRNGTERSWDDNYVGISVSASGIKWAILVDAPWLVYVVSQPKTYNMSHESGPESWPAEIKIVSEEFDVGNSRLARTIWKERFPGAGCGAIAADHRVAVALRNGRFYVFDARPKPPGSTYWGHTLVDVPIDFSPYDMSIVESGYAILAAGDPIDKPSPRTELDRHLALRAQRIEETGELLPRWKTVLHHLGPDGVETYRHEVPFEVLQPPIDAGNGRIYLMGNGTAAFQDGKLLFLTASSTPMFGTAFDDGTMAIAAGFELRIVGADGKVRQTFTTAEQEAITAPPAIGSDGSVWVGTTKALYVAR